MRRAAAAVLLVITLTGCAPSPAAPTAPESPAPLPPSWTLNHAVLATDRISITGGSISAYEQSIELHVNATKGRPAGRCSVQADVSGDGGPDRWVGEKVATSVRGRPALRNGAGAEGPYLIWRDADGRWMTVQCDEEATMAEVADRVRPERTSRLRIPFGLTPPEGYLVSSVRVSSDPLNVAVSIDRPDQAYDEGLYVTLRPMEMAAPDSAPTTVSGRPGLRTTHTTYPSVCVSVRPSPPPYVCVGIPPDDTGPNPDRTDDLPAIESIAASLSFAELDDPTTWFDADQALR